MQIVRFAILGAKGNCGAVYWICFAVYCVLYVGRAIKEAANEVW